MSRAGEGEDTPRWRGPVSRARRVPARRGGVCVESNPSWQHLRAYLVRELSVLFGQSRLHGEIFGELADLCVAERLRHCPHDGVMARAAAILLQRLDQVVVLLASQARRFGRNRLIAARTVTSRT